MRHHKNREDRVNQLHMEMEEILVERLADLPKDKRVQSEAEVLLLLLVLTLRKWYDQEEEKRFTQHLKNLLRFLEQEIRDFANIHIRFFNVVRKEDREKGKGEERG